MLENVMVQKWNIKKYKNYYNENSGGGGGGKL